MNTGNIGNRNIRVFNGVDVDLKTIKNKNIQSFYGTAVVSKELRQFHGAIYEKVGSGKIPKGPRYDAVRLKEYHVMGGYVGFDENAPERNRIYLSNSKNIREDHNRAVRTQLYAGLVNTLNPNLTLKETTGYDSGTGRRQEQIVGEYRPLGSELNSVEDEGTATKDAQRFLREAQKTLLDGGNATKPLRTFTAAKLMAEATHLASTPEMKFRRNFPMAHKFAKKFILSLCPRNLSCSNMQSMHDSYKFLGQTLLTTPLTPSDKPKPIGPWAARNYKLVDVKPLTDAGLQNQNGQLCVLAKWGDICDANKGKITQSQLRDKLKYVSVVPVKKKLDGDTKKKTFLELEDVTAKMQSIRNVFMPGANKVKLKKVNTLQIPQPNPMMNANRGNQSPVDGQERTIRGVRCRYRDLAMTERQSGWYNVQTNELVMAE